MHRTLRLAMPPVILAVAGCAAPTAATAPPAPVAPAIEATPAHIVLGSCAQKPVYPEAARRENRQGKVAVSFHIDVDNGVIASKVVRSSGHADLDEAARVGLAKCKFKAATQNGSPVREWAPVQYVWSI